MYVGVRGAGRNTPGEIRWLGEGLGAQNMEVFGELLGLDSEDLGALREQGSLERDGF